MKVKLQIYDLNLQDYDSHVLGQIQCFADEHYASKNKNTNAVKETVLQSTIMPVAPLLEGCNPIRTASEIKDIIESLTDTICINDHTCKFLLFLVTCFIDIIEIYPDFVHTKIITAITPLKIKRSSEDIGYQSLKQIMY